MIGKSGGEDLRLIFQAAESPRVDDSVAIALKIAAIGVWQFRIAAASRTRRGKTQPAKPVHCGGRLLARLIAALLTPPWVLPRSGSISCRARLGSLFLIRSASASVAASLETRTVG